MTKLKGTLRKLDLHYAMTPREGSVMVNRYWVVDDDGLYWWQPVGSRHMWAPQCNPDQRITESLRDKLYPDARVGFLDVVYVGHWDPNYGYNPCSGL